MLITPSRHSCVQNIFGALFSISIPKAPESDSDDLPSDFMTFLGTFMAFAWLAGISQAA